jgi:Raf kinase inhibitor-like YbhB/YbcL family protein
VHRATPLITVVAAAIAVSACSNDGRELRDPVFPLPPTTTTSLPPGDTFAPVPEQPAILSMVAPWPDGATVPARHTCDDADVSPALTWTDLPPETVEVALTVTDLDADGFAHWVVTGIDPIVTGLTEGAAPTGAIEWANDFGAPGWGGPCPPAGEPAHFYLFTVHALNQPLVVADDASAAEVVEALNAQAIAQASVSGTYARPG